MDILIESNEITENLLEEWQALPKLIRDDPCFALFLEEYEKLNTDGKRTIDKPKDTSDNNNFTAINFSNDHENRPRTDNSLPHNAINEEMEPKNKRRCVKILKLIILLTIWAMFTGFLMRTTEKIEQTKMMFVPAHEYKDFVFPNIFPNNQLRIKLKGSFYNDVIPSSISTSNALFVYVQRIYLGYEDTNGSSNGSLEITFTENITDVWTIPIVDESLLDFAEETKKTKVFTLQNLKPELGYGGNLSSIRLRMSTNMGGNIPLEMSYNETPIDRDAGVMYAAIVLCGLYIMIIWEVVHRTFAAMIASTLAIGILAAMNERPSMAVIISWIDVETLLLLFGMMILVAILSETGLFDYLAVLAYKITSGHIWSLIYCLCFFNAIMSSILDNVTAALLLTPVTIRLCEVMELNPVPILMSMIIYSNIGGALTPVGDPPNVIIASNKFIVDNGVNFVNFTVHMSIGVIVVMLQTFLQLRLRYRNVASLRFSETIDVQELRKAISVWENSATDIHSKDNGDLIHRIILVKLDQMKTILKEKITSGSVPINYKETLEQLQAKYRIRSKSLLFKSTFALLFVLTLFFLHSVPSLQHLSLGWSALIGAMLLLILADREDIESILARVEWATLLFFGALFILMEALSELGLIDWIGMMTKNLILSVDEGSRLTVAILLILWVSAIASAFLDNIPVTTMMVKIVISLVENKDLNLPLHPLVWALAFGACFGGNGTLIGASANLVCAGIAEQHGYKFTFLQYMKVAFPIMLVSVTMASGYLLLAHVLLGWH